MMTQDQQKVVDRCKAMLKTVFGSQACRIVFRLVAHKPDVKADVTYLDVGASRIEQKEGVVDLRA